MKVLGEVLKPGGIILLCAIDRRVGSEKAKAAGPPYSLSESHVRELFEHLPWVKAIHVLREKDLMLDEGSRWRNGGLEEVAEVVFVIEKK